MTALAAQSTTAPAESPLVEALFAISSAPNLFAAAESYLANPATSKPIRRMLAHILDLGERLSTAQAVAS